MRRQCSSLQCVSVRPPLRSAPATVLFQAIIHCRFLPVAHDLWADVDLVIGLGTRLQSQVMAWGQDDAMKIIHIDIDETQIAAARVWMSAFTPPLATLCLFCWMRLNLCH